MTRRGLLLGALLITLGLISTQTQTGGQSAPEAARWEYKVVNHSPYLRHGGSDLNRFNGLGKDGWELAGSYPIKGEVFVSVFKRRR